MRPCAAPPLAGRSSRQASRHLEQARSRDRPHELDPMKFVGNLGPAGIPRSPTVDEPQEEAIAPRRTRPPRAIQGVSALGASALALGCVLSPADGADFSSARRR